MNKEKLLPKQYKRFRPEAIETDSAFDVVLSMVTDSLKQGRPATYPETKEGLEQFKENVIGYFEFVRQNNANPAHDKKIIVDIESLCVFLGISRMTLLTYEKNRGSEWQTFIKQTKEAITACKKQLIFHQQIPSIIGIFDLTNNSGYVNSSEFKVQAQADEKQVQADRLISELDAAGLVWDSEKREYIPAKGANE